MHRIIMSKIGIPLATCCVIAFACLAIAMPGQQQGSSPPSSQTSQLEPLAVDDGVHHGEVLLNLSLDSAGAVANASALSGGGDLVSIAIANTRLFRHPTRPGASGLTQRVIFFRGKDVKTVPPEYPMLARNAHVWGAVRMVATVASDGHVDDVTILFGAPLLQNSARDSVLKWKFPLIEQQGSPVSYHAVVTINYSLQ